MSMRSTWPLRAAKRTVYRLATASVTCHCGCLPYHRHAWTGVAARDDRAGYCHNTRHGLEQRNQAASHDWTLGACRVAAADRPAAAVPVEASVGMDV
eukprot:CAMPEP_0114476410 /NCGR_PEP_ID=MMETSP0104-20121206/14735_1 /TAXON_ID=37642 ORGANISM="Paraphysomonas imperforata, Strain PA2" /NCGR_SAMPLE_ID=MMETSP0104 /ASSEMBLY_ACC=CAM_ASM_000202 /LENGTH=96 /DNA_ID=CAMNT_0001651129 /DNA_START=878 /DNA_END=1168 /DNA_ORIENTATION=+